MTSILTNTAAMASLQTLRSIDAKMADAQRQVSSGLRVQDAGDNAAYWSISTTMRSDSVAISAVSDALGLGAAKVDVAYAGLDSTVSVLSEFRAKLVAAKEGGIDRNKIQAELEQFKDQLVSIASSASFNGVNWLSTNVPNNLMELSHLPESITSSFIRAADGSVRVGTTMIDIADISLFNVGGGGALQKDPRSIGDIGGFRNIDESLAKGIAGYQEFQFSGAFALAAGETISFQVAVDGTTTYTITIDANTINAALSKVDGTVSSASEYAEVIQYALGAAASVASVSSVGDRIRISTKENTGSPNSSISVSGVTFGPPPGTFGAGLENPPVYEVANDFPRREFPFTAPFTVHHGVEFYFDIQVDNSPVTRITVDRDTVDTALGTSDGKVASASDLAQVLDHALYGKGLNVGASGTTVVFTIDPAVYPDAGTRASLRISNVTDNIGAGADFDLVDVDITDPANDLDNYLAGLDAMLQRVISGASSLGAIKTRIDMQEDFAQTLIDTVEKGIGRLVDADMNEASTRIKALQTQQQLAIQSLHIANGNAEHILQLFRD